MRVLSALVVVLLIAAPVPLNAATATRTQDSLCLMLEAAAREHDLPVSFLVSVIWRESRFDPHAVGPLTRSGERALGIAQFMPGTAAEQGLSDPFDPVQALPRAAAFLQQLRQQFGNLGLAAAAYNAGPARVQGWLAGTRSLPDETRSYVQAITGHSAEEWAKSGVTEAAVPAKDCLQVLASLERAPSSRFFCDLTQRVQTALSKPWGIELAAGFSREHVLKQYSIALGKVAPLIGNHDPILTAAHRRGLRPFYNAWIGVDSRDLADRMCGKIRSSGGACIVLHL